MHVRICPLTHEPRRRCSEARNLVSLGDGANGPEPILANVFDICSVKSKIDGNLSSLFIIFVCYSFVYWLNVTFLAVL